MDFWNSVKVLGRQWRVFIPALLIAGLVTGAVLYKVKPTYGVTTDVLLVPPKVTQNSSTTTGPTNPYLGFGNLNTVAAILSARETGPDNQARLARMGGTGTFTATPDPTGDVPEVILTVSGSAPAETLTTTRVLAQDLQSQLISMQLNAGAPRPSLITTQVINPANTATKQNKSRYRVAGAVGTVTLILAIAVAFIAESVSNRERGRRRRDESRGEAEVTEPPATGAADAARSEAGPQIAGVPGRRSSERAAEPLVSVPRDLPSRG